MKPLPAKIDELGQGKLQYPYVGLAVALNLLIDAVAELQEKEEARTLTHEKLTQEWGIATEPRYTITELRALVTHTPWDELRVYGVDMEEVLKRWITWLEQQSKQGE